MRLALGAIDVQGMGWAHVFAHSILPHLSAP